MRKARAITTVLFGLLVLAATLVLAERPDAPFTNKAPQGQAGTVSAHNTPDSGSPRCRQPLRAAMGHTVWQAPSTRDSRGPIALAIPDQWPDIVIASASGKKAKKNQALPRLLHDQNAKALLIISMPRSRLPYRERGLQAARPGSPRASPAS